MFVAFCSTLQLVINICDINRNLWRSWATAIIMKDLDDNEMFNEPA